MGDSAAPPLHLGFVVESETKPMETGGGGSAASLVPGRGEEWPPSPALRDDEDLSKPSDDDGSKPSDDDNDAEWLVSGSEEDEDHEDR